MEDAMTLETDVRDYLMWMKVHNYATTTVENRKCYLGYLLGFLEYVRESLTRPTAVDGDRRRVTKEPGDYLPPFIP
jgi:hypothetical protein